MHASRRYLRLPTAVIIAASLAVGSLIAAGPMGPANAVGTTATTGEASAETAQIFAEMRERWRTFVTGGEVDIADADIAARITSITKAATTRMNSLNRDPARTYLWSDQQNWSKSATTRTNFLRVFDMALAYGTQGSTLYGDAALAADITSALEWLYANKYNESMTPYDNWWEWEIGNPRTLADVLAIMYDVVPEDLVQGYVRTINRFNPDPTYQTWNPSAPPGAAHTDVVMTGANLLDKVFSTAASGMLGNDPARIELARQAMQPIYATVTKGDGFYADGSFVQHGFIAYIGGYGSELMNAVTKLAYMAQGTPWEFPIEELRKTYTWFDDSIAPLISRGAMTDMVGGRKISRAQESDHKTGRNMIIAARRLADIADPEAAARITSLLRGWMLQDTSFPGGYTAGLGLYDLPRIKALMADDSITPSQLETTRVYGSMGRAVQQTPAYGFGLSMFSDRISSFSYGNGENAKGWLLGAGMTYLYTDDLTQYSNNYWATVDYRRLPGITTDQSDFGKPIDWSFYGNAAGVNWTGGSQVLNRYAAAGMAFDMSGFFSREKVQTASETTGRVSPSTLTGRKSWFLLGDRIVAMGSGITDTVGKPVETMVENRKLSPAGDNVLTVDGAVVPAEISATPVDLTQVRWAHLAGKDASAQGIGYYFPTTTDLSLLREQRQGAWSDVNAGGPTAPVTDNYLSLAVEHGVDPTDASYAYVLMPGATAEQVEAEAADPAVRLLRTTSGVDAASYTPPASDSEQPVSKVIAANFWEHSGGSVLDGKTPLLTSSAAASVTVALAGQNTTIGVADPTEVNEGKIVIELRHPARTVTTSDPAIKVLKLGSTIRLEVDVKNANGRTLSVTLGM